MKDRKMSDIFELPMKVDGYSVESQPSISAGCVAELASDIECDSAMDATYVAHAINNHDRMAEEMAELRSALKSMIGKGIDLLNIEDVTDEEDAFSIHSKFNDAIINSELLLAKLNKND